MTDITELAQSLKAAAEGVIKNYDCEWFETGRQICTVHKSKINLIGLANPANILALVEALEKAKGMEAYWKTQCRGITDHCEELQARIAELEREQEHLRPVGVMSEKAFHRLENSESRFIALWPRPGIFLPRKRPEDGVIVYARTAAAAGIKMEAE